MLGNMPLYKYCSTFLISFLSFFSYAEKVRLDIATYPEHAEDVINALVIDDCVLGDSVINGGNYIVGEAIILCQALRLGGIEPEFVIQSAPSQQRALRAMELGLLFTASYSFWGADHNPKYFYQTQEVLPKGEYYKGIYTTSSNKRLLEIMDLRDITQFRGVSNRLWKKDWRFLECMGIEAVDTKNHINMAKMVSAQRVDFTLGRIKGQGDFSYSLFGETLVPVPGIRIVFNDSHRFLISKKYPQSARLFRALEEGLTRLADSGQLKTIYQYAQFYKDELKDWVSYECINGEIKEFAIQANH